MPMAHSLAVFVSLVLVAALTDGAVLTSGTQCKTSYDCGRGSCCRDSSGTVLSQQEGGFMHFPQPPSGHGGTCSTQLAQMGDACDSNCQCDAGKYCVIVSQMGEMCDSNRQCDAGMECYRPMSGVCCPPMTCHNATWVQQQKAYWANCAADPHCFPPP